MSLTSVLSVANIRRATNALKTATPRVPTSMLVRVVPESLTPNPAREEMKVITKFVRDIWNSTEPEKFGIATHDVCAHLRRAIPRVEVNEIIRYFVPQLKAFELDYGAFDTFAFCGMSGALIAPILAHLMEKELLMVRKNGGADNSNASRAGFYVEGFVQAKRIIVVDDLIGTGATMKNIREGITQGYPEAKFVAMLLYENFGFPQLFLPNSAVYECRHLWPDIVSEETKTRFF
jgi:adenine/guanine phosphoribosyltransferase-like PRPP-binding protein